MHKFDLVSLLSDVDFCNLVNASVSRVVNKVSLLSIRAGILFISICTTFVRQISGTLLSNIDTCRL